MGDSHLRTNHGVDEGRGLIMTTRKLPDSYEETPFFEGYLHSRIEKRDLPKYGYKSNHIPNTSGKTRETVSSFTIAQKLSNQDK